MDTARRNRRVRSASARGVGLCVCLSAVLGGGPVTAQMVNLDPMPWTAPTDSLAGPSLEIGIDRFEEPKFGWAADRLLATVRIPSGPDAGYFVRIPHATLDFGDTPLLARWPWIEGAEATDEFWTERRVTSFGQLEIGGDRRLDWPWIGRFGYGAALGLPVGTDRLYPLSSISFPLRFELRKSLAAGSLVQADLDGGALVHVDSGGERLDQGAFPGGWHAGLGLRLGAEAGRHLRLEFDHQDREGRLSQRVGAALVLPRGDRSSWRLGVDRELAGTLNRFAAWRFGLAWRFDHRPRLAAPVAQKPADPGSRPGEAPAGDSADTTFPVPDGAPGSDSNQPPD